MSLTIRVQSFSYLKEGIPTDPSGNGGGFVFDCRGILNPGRINEYKTKTGRDQGVINYLETETLMPQFIKNIKELIAINIENYLARDFKNLDINFGCTGGQHRSVYAADQAAQFIKDTYPEAIVELKHIVQEKKNWVNETY